MGSTQRQSGMHYWVPLISAAQGHAQAVHSEAPLVPMQIVLLLHKSAAAVDAG